MMTIDRAWDYRSILMFCRSLVAGGFDRDDFRSGFGVSIDVGVFSIAGREEIRS
jgi:hypothetical protein